MTFTRLMLLLHIILVDYSSRRKCNVTSLSSYERKHIDHLLIILYFLAITWYLNVVPKKKL